MKRVMIVDDSMSARRLIISLCSGISNLEFLEAKDGLDAFSQLSELNTPVDLILSDHNMPEMKGIDLLLKVKQQEKLKNIPFVFITSEDDGDLIVEALSNGANEYMTKPFDQSTFLEKVGPFL